MMSARRLGRPWWLETEMATGVAALVWGALAYGTHTDMAQRPSLSALSFMSDAHWALLVGIVSALQVMAVLYNTKWGRWLTAIPMCVFWLLCSYTILNASYYHNEEMPLAFGLYAVAAISNFAKIASMPKEFPPFG